MFPVSSVAHDFEDIDFDAIGTSGGDRDRAPRPVINLPPIGEREKKRAKRRRRLVFWISLPYLSRRQMPIPQ